MTKFTSFKKLSKKEQKKLNSQKRTVWEFSPVTRTVPNKKTVRKRMKGADFYD